MVRIDWSSGRLHSNAISDVACCIVFASFIPCGTLEAMSVSTFHREGVLGGLALLLSACWSAPSYEGLACSSSEPCPMGWSCTRVGVCTALSASDGFCDGGSCSMEDGGPKMEDASDGPVEVSDGGTIDGGFEPGLDGGGSRADSGAASCASGVACDDRQRCDDGNACTTETCDIDTGCCVVSMVMENLPCASDSNVCTVDVCDGAGMCIHPFGGEGQVCAPQIDECDIAEMCPGDALCPDNRTEQDQTPCSLGTCIGGFCLPEARQGLVAYLKFDEPSGVLAYDAVRGGRTAMLFNDVQRVSGQLGGALHFDQTDDYVRFDDLEYGHTFTVAFWFRAAESSLGVYQMLYSHGVVATVNRVEIYLHPEGRIMTLLADSSGTNIYLPTPANVVFADGRWHHYALTYVVGGGAKIYVDGSAWIDNDTVTGPIQPTTAVFLGTRADLSSSHRFSGELDDVRIFDRSLSAGEVIDLYLSSAGTEAIFLVPEADTYVQAGADTALMNFGTETRLRVKFGPQEGGGGGGDFHRDAYLRFDLTDVPPVASAVLSLVLISRGRDTPIDNALYFVSNDVWQETEMTFATAPAAGARLSTFAVPPAATPIDLNVSLQVQENQEENGRISFSVQSPSDQGGDSLTIYGSREDNAHTPKLYLTFD